MAGAHFGRNLRSSSRERSPLPDSLQPFLPQAAPALLPWTRPDTCPDCDSTDARVRRATSQSRPNPSLSFSSANYPFDAVFALIVLLRSDGPDFWQSRKHTTLSTLDLGHPLIEHAPPDELAAPEA